MLLPGMDGSGRLFGPFMAALPPGVTAQVSSYRTDVFHDYDELARGVTLPDEPFALVAESFAGPLGLRIAAARPVQLRALVLVASFVVPPSWIPAAWVETLLPLLALRTPPRWVIRRLLVDKEAPEGMVDELVEAIRAVAPRVMAARLGAVQRLDARADLVRGNVPVLLLTGARDRLVGRACVDAILRARPDVRHVELDAPHLVLQRRPRESAHAVSDFLQALGGSA